MHNVLASVCFELLLKKSDKAFYAYNAMQDLQKYNLCKLSKVATLALFS